MNVICTGASLEIPSNIRRHIYDDKGTKNSDFRRHFERSVVDVRDEIRKMLIQNLLGPKFFEIYLRRHNFCLSGVGYSYVGHMHPAPVGQRIGAGWMRDVVPRFNRKLAKKQLEATKPGATSTPAQAVPAVEQPIRFECLPPPTFLKTTRIRKVDMDQSNKDIDEILGLKDLSLDPCVFYRRMRVRRSPSCPNLDRGSYPSLLKDYVGPVLSKSEQRRDPITHGFRVGTAVAEAGLMSYRPGYDDPEHELEVLQRPARYGYVLQPAPLKAAFPGADKSGAIPTDLKGDPPPGRGRVTHFLATATKAGE